MNVGVICSPACVHDGLRSSWFENLIAIDDPTMFLTCLLSVCFSLCLVASLTVCLRRKRGARDALLRLLDPELAHPDRQHLVDRAVQTATDDVLHSFFCTPSGRRLHRSVACCHVVDRVVSEVQVPACVATLLCVNRSLMCQTCSRSCSVFAQDSSR